MSTRRCYGLSTNCAPRERERLATNQFCILHSAIFPAVAEESRGLLNIRCFTPTSSLYSDNQFGYQATAHNAG